MNLLRLIRKRRQRWLPPVMGMLAVVWLGMVLQPCVMAAEMDSHCPHCPMPMEQGCGHALADECTYIDRVDYDGRTAHVRPAVGAPDESPVFVTAAAMPFSLDMAACSTGPPSDAASAFLTPSLNVLFCVYLN